eukprot:850988-Rhodomonas_salina.1
MESSPGISDVYIPLGVMEYKGERLCEGDVLTAVVGHHDVGKAKYKCLDIVDVTRTAPDLTDERVDTEVSASVVDEL